MSTTRPSVPGTTRVCPHCRTTILETASVCPACRHHLRFDPGAAKRASATTTALQVEGTITHPPSGPAWEYSVLVTVRNAKGEEVSRHVVGVGSLEPGEHKSFSLSVEVSNGFRSDG